MLVFNLLREGRIYRCRPTTVQACSRSHGSCSRLRPSWPRRLRTVWGWGSGETGGIGAGFYSQYVSYAYPGGASVKPINSVVVSPVVR